jgi:enoyl-CoA hydratase/carnithine racemase
MQYLQKNCSSINVRINSVGGNVLDGYAIISAILNCSVPCNTYIDGLGASIAGVIAVAGKKCYMMDYGTLMIHSASGSEDKAMLDLVDGTINKILSNRTSKTPEQISDIMKAETWFTADEALNSGLVDEVVNTSKKIKVKKESLQNMALVYNQLITKKPKMEKVFNKLSVTNEDEAVVAIEAINAEHQKLVNELEELKKKLAEFEAKELEATNKAKEDLKVKATEFAENLVKEGKAKEEEKEEIITNAIANFEFVSNMFSKIGGVKNAIKVFDLKNFAGKKGAEDRSEWTIRDWETKDSAGLMEIKNQTPDLYNEMKDKFYKKTN